MPSRGVTFDEATARMVIRGAEESLRRARRNSPSPALHREHPVWPKRLGEATIGGHTVASGAITADITRADGLLIEDASITMTNLPNGTVIPSGIDALVWLQESDWQCDITWQALVPVGGGGSGTPGAGGAGLVGLATLTTRSSATLYTGCSVVDQYGDTWTAQSVALPQAHASLVVTGQDAMAVWGKFAGETYGWYVTGIIPTATAAPVTALQADEDDSELQDKTRTVYVLQADSESEWDAWHEGTECPELGS